jgi:hypothetical protein
MCQVMGPTRRLWLSRKLDLYLTASDSMESVTRSDTVAIPRLSGRDCECGEFQRDTDTAVSKASEFETREERGMPTR